MVLREYNESHHLEIICNPGKFLYAMEDVEIWLQ